MWWRRSTVTSGRRVSAKVRTGRPDCYSHSSQGLLNCQLFIRKIYPPFKAQHEDETLSSFQFIISLSGIPPLLISHPISLSVCPSLAVSILHHFNNSKWYIKVNEICHTSGHYDACQGFVSSVRRTAAAHQRPVLLSHHVEYWISKVLENTVAPLISKQTQATETPHAFISRKIFPLHILQWRAGTLAGTSPHLFSCKILEFRQILSSMPRFRDY